MSPPRRRRATWRFVWRVVIACLALGPLGLALECGSQEVDVVTIPLPDVSCRTEADGGTVASADGGAGCPSGQFCQTAACGDASGTCQPRGTPDECTGAAAFVCGCDEISYFNDCLRQAAGVSASTPGGCSSIDTAICLGGMCPKAAKATCAFIVPSLVVDLLSLPDSGCIAQGSLQVGTVGACWILPPTAPASGPKTFRRFVPVAAPPTLCAAPTCVDAFTAIRAGGIYEEAADCLP